MRKPSIFTPDLAGFSDYFKQATGHEPFPYQWRLVSSDRFPSLLNVPTGAGKTAAAILGWLWRRRFSTEDVRSRTPRRLVYCLPMRVLVEQTRDSATRWLQALDLWAEKPGDVRPASDGKPRISVSLLMGGEAADDWDAYPERDAILIGTQDMLLSRALNRGYGMSRYRWPIHFALLNNDSLWVMDEVQLMGAGLRTTAQLQAFREEFQTYGPAESLWMSATLKTDALETVDFREQIRAGVQRAVGLTAEDRQHPQLAPRLAADKRLFKAKTVLSKDNEKKGYAGNLAREIAAWHRPGTFTLVVLNRVRRAQDVFQALRSLPPTDAEAPELLLIHSRFRPHERQTRQERLQQVDQAPPPGGCIVVATQAVEAGVDVSARLLFTELAPWTSLVQRFGRCNRRGEWKTDDPAQVFWVDIAGDKDLGDLALPYEPSDLARARGILAACTAVGPQELAGIDDPVPAPLTHVLRRRDLLDLFDTTPDLAGHDLDVSRYIRDTEDTDVQVYWREWVGDVPPDDLPPPRREELCAVSLPAVRGFLKDAPAYRWDSLDRQWIHVGGRDPVWPGVTLLIPAGAGGYDRDLGWTGTGQNPVRVVPGADDESLEKDAYDADAASFVGRFVHLTDHSEDDARALEQLLTCFADLPGLPWDDLRRATRWHDAGKAHAAFQHALLAGRDTDDPLWQGGPWAKSDVQGGRLRYGIMVDGPFQERRHFRHELASALLLLQTGGSDLAAYLAAAHHGKVRLSIRSLPDEVVPPDGRRFARGVWDGDEIPALDLGAGVRTPATRLRLAVMELGEGPDGPSWLERALALRDQYGPFRLAWLETLVRLADWRGTTIRARIEREEVVERA